MFVRARRLSWHWKRNISFSLTTISGSRRVTEHGTVLARKERCIYVLNRFLQCFDYREHWLSIRIYYFNNTFSPPLLLDDFSWLMVMIGHILWRRYSAFGPIHFVRRHWLLCWNFLLAVQSHKWSATSASSLNIVWCHQSHQVIFSLCNTSEPFVLDR